MNSMKIKELGIYTKKDDYYVTVSVQKQGRIYNFLEDCVKNNRKLNINRE